MGSTKGAQQALTNEIIQCHNHLGYSAINWFEWLLDDCLASFGKKLTTPWNEKQTAKLFELSKLYATAVKEAPFSDILGSVYQELASNYGKKYLGQYFTPFHVAKMMSQINFDKELFNNNTVRVLEPASGSGVMILALLNVLMEEDQHLIKKLSITCIDLDRICVKMSALQIMSNIFFHTAGLGELIIMHGNALLDPRDIETFYHVSNPEFDHIQQIENEKISIEPPDEQSLSTDFDFITPKKQLSLFDF